MDVDDYNNYSYENDSPEDINPNQPIDLTMKLPAKSHLNKLEVNVLFFLKNQFFLKGYSLFFESRFRRK